MDLVCDLACVCVYYMHGNIDTKWTELFEDVHKYDLNWIQVLSDAFLCAAMDVLNS